MEAIEDDRHLRAMVSLIEVQAEQVAALRHAVDKLEGMLALRDERHGRAIEVIEEGLDEIRNFYRRHSRQDLLEQSGEIQSLDS